MKKILCYGDSNTWGDPPGSVGRFPTNVRWTGILQAKLGKNFQIIEEGRCGRTTIFNDPQESDLNGLSSLPEILKKYLPINLLVIMLGTNDLKDCFNASAEQIAHGIEKIVKTAYNFNLSDKQILVVCPPPITNTNDREVSLIFSKGLDKSKQLATAYQPICQKLQCSLLNAANFVKSSEVDGIHLDPKNHESLAFALSIKISEMILTNSNKFA